MPETHPRPVKSGTLGVGPSLAFYISQSNLNVRLGPRTTGLLHFHASPLRAENTLCTLSYPIFAWCRCLANISWTKFLKMKESCPNSQDWAHRDTFLGQQIKARVLAYCYSHNRDLKEWGKERSRSFQLTVHHPLTTCHLSLVLFSTLQWPRDQGSESRLHQLKKK